MAWRGIDMPAESGVSRGLSSLQDAFVRAAQHKQRQEQMAAENLKAQFGMKRQTQMDYQDALAKAQKRAELGDYAGAQSIMAPYGAQMEEREVRTPIERPPEAPPNLAPSQALQGLDDPNAIAEQTAAEDWQGSKKPTLAEMAREYNTSMARKLYGKGPDGNQWSIDPEAQREVRGQRLDQAFGASEDPLTRELYPQMRPALVASEQGVDASDVFRHIQGEKNTRNQMAREDAREQARLDAERRRNEEWDRRFAPAEAGRNARAAISGAHRGAAVGQGAQRIALAEEAAARAAASTVLRNLKANEVIVSDRKYSDMLHQIHSDPNSALDAATAGQWVKLAQGGVGVISDSDMKVFWHDIGGIGDYVEGKVQGLINGQIAAGKRDTVAKAMQKLAGRAKTNLAGIQRAMEHHFDSSPLLKDYKDQMVGTYFPAYREKIQEKGKSQAGGGKGDGLDKYRKQVWGQ